MFRDQSCDGKRFSQGHWKNDTGIIVLTSFDEFKEKDQQKITDKNKSKAVTTANARLKNGELLLLSIEKNANVSPTFLRPNDTSFVYLNIIQLQLTNDTLVCLSSGKLPGIVKFYRNGNM